MLAIFKYCGEIITAIVKMWKNIEIGGFYPFWYLVGIGLLTIFGFFLRGLLFSGAGGGEVSGIAKKWNKDNGSKVKIVKSKKK